MFRKLTHFELGESPEGIDAISRGSQIHLSARLGAAGLESQSGFEAGRATLRVAVRVPEDGPRAVRAPQAEKYRVIRNISASIYVLFQDKSKPKN